MSSSSILYYNSNDSNSKQFFLKKPTIGNKRYNNLCPKRKFDCGVHIYKKYNFYSKCVFCKKRKINNLFASVLCKKSSFKNIDYV